MMTKTAYQPKILAPTLKQRIPGVRIFLIQSERDPNQFHFIGIYPDGYIRCQCEAGKHNRQCKHKLVLCEHIEAAQRVEPMLADMTAKELVEAFNRRRTRNSLPLLPIPQCSGNHATLDNGCYCPVCGWQQMAKRFDSPRTTNVIATRPVPQATFACSRTGYGKETAPLADNSYAGSIFR